MQHCNISGNNCSNNYYGIYLDASCNNEVTGNTASSNNHDGIRLYSSSNNKLTGNNAYDNHDDGVQLYSSGNNNLTDNTVNSNNKYGIQLDASSNNRIYNNYFNNTNNAWDDGNNIWNTTRTPGTNIIGGPYLGGNYWSDYGGKDLDGDGHVSTKEASYSLHAEVVGEHNVSAIASNANGTDMQTWVWNVAASKPPEITSFAPPSPVNDTEGATRTFSITVNQTVNVSWQINGSVIQTDIKVTEASYTNTSAVVGTWNVSAIVNNANGSDMQTWVWTVEPSPCFIATAAYGTPLHEDINVLRDLRDEYMMPNPAGRAFVKTYYTLSPPIADVIRANEGLQTAVRAGLVKPLVHITEMFVG